MNLRRKLLQTIILTFLAAPVAQAQQRQSWDEYLATLTATDDNDIAISEDTYNVLSSLADNPIDINTATRDELSRIPFLTAQQIEDIEAYVYQYHGMRSAAELAMIESLDPTRRQLLAYFVTFGNSRKESFPTLANIFKYGKHELLASAKIPFYDRQGDRNGYLGPKYRHSLRYDFRLGTFVRFGIQGSQDAGEPFLANRNTLGYDHYSFYLVLRRLGRLKALAVGQYKLRFGMGLVMNSDVGFGKLMTLSTLARTTNSIRPNTSRSISNYLQGAAATVSLPHGMDVTAFLSYRGIDATINKDGTIATIRKNGYHRTPTEMKTKNAARQTTAGSNINWQKGAFHAGITAIYSHLDRRLNPDRSRAFRMFYPHGTDFWNASVDYGYTDARLSLHGETATGGCHGIATINSMSLSPSGTLSILALQRFYSRRYSSLFSRSFSENGSVQNESGIYVGVNWQAMPSLTLMAYSDFAYFAQPRYQASWSSHCFDNSITATWARGNWTVLGRYRLKMRQKDDYMHSRLIYDATQRGRLSVGYGKGSWQVKAQGDVAYDSYIYDSFGWMTTVEASASAWLLRMAANAGYFHTEDYASRIYAYERGTMYNFYFPSFSGEGVRCALFVRADISKRLMIIAKCSTTDYFDRDHTASGLQRIDSSTQTDMEMQVRYKF